MLNPVTDSLREIARVLDALPAETGIYPVARARLHITIHHAGPDQAQAAAEATAKTLDLTPLADHVITWNSADLNLTLTHTPQPAPRPFRHY